MDVLDFPTEPRTLDPLAQFYDAEVLRALAAVRRVETGTLEQVRAALGAVRWTVEDIGFGAVAARGDRTAGSFDLRVEAVGHAGRVVWLLAELRWRLAPGPRQRALVRALVGAALTPRPGARSASLEVRDVRRISAMDRERHAELGAPPAVDVPPALADALSTLIAPGGALTPGAAAVAAIVAARRADLLRVALRGPNPGGRVFAAQALLSGAAGPATDADLRAISVLRATPAPILAGAGCSLRETVAARLLPAA